MKTPSSLTLNENAVIQSAGSRRKSSFRLTKRSIYRFLTVHAQSGCTEDTIRQYRAAIQSFYDFLPADKNVFPDSLAQWQETLLAQGYSSRTVSTRLSAVNTLFAFLERRDFQYYFKFDRAEAQTPVLTRKEYIQLLQEARRQENITLYLLVKTFAVMGLSIQSLDNLTREAINQGAVITDRKKYIQTSPLPALLRQELLDYAMREGIRSGPVFRSKSGKAVSRGAITNAISKLGEAVGLEPGKANPRSLKGLYQNTFAEYQRQADAWMTKCYAELLMEEEAQAGWMAGKGG